MQFLKKYTVFTKQIRKQTNKQIRKYKMTEKEIFEKYANLSEDESNKKSNKNDVMSTAIKSCRGGGKGRGGRGWERGGQEKEKQMDLEKN